MFNAKRKNIVVRIWRLVVYRARVRFYVYESVVCDINRPFFKSISIVLARCIPVESYSHELCTSRDRQEITTWTVSRNSKNGRSRVACRSNRAESRCTQTKPDANGTTTQNVRTDGRWPGRSPCTRWSVSTSYGWTRNCATRCWYSTTATRFRYTGRFWAARAIIFGQ